ncbi:MAG TPA: DNA translocase FtsK 4TM domain-containing protein [bacterium]|nr:DNA translocase FtsK 4TM domain-containing protein [bacterium]
MRKRTKKKSPVKAAQPLLDARKSEELLGLLLILFGLLLAIGLISYQGENPQEVTANLVRNQLGIAGVYLSWALIHGTIGFPVIVLPFLLIALGVFKLLGRETAQLRRWSWLPFSSPFSSRSASPFITMSPVPPSPRPMNIRALSGCCWRHCCAS